jgi:hypothetical protein
LIALHANAHAHHALETRLKQFAAFHLVADACFVIAPRYPVKMKRRVRRGAPAPDVPLYAARQHFARTVVACKTVCDSPSRLLNSDTLPLTPAAQRVA